MADTRYQVFVSSTFLDLQEERAAVVSALLQMEAFPAGMELFPAADDDAWTLIERVIDSSDYYLLVIGGKYGSVDPDTELSFTEKEYDYAVKEGRPVMAFLHSDPDKIALGKSEKDVAAREKLTAFREKVKDKKHVKYWSGPDDLGGKVALSFADFRQRYSAAGWIRGDAATAAESLEEINDLRKRLAELERERDTARSGPPPGAEKLARGGDLVSFKPKFEAELRRAGEQSWQSVTARGSLDVDISWNDLFSCVGPILLHEAEESDLLERISDWLENEYSSLVRERVEKIVEEAGDELEEIESTRIELDTDAFGTFIVQFRALGLIAKSDRARSVKDTGTYWTITPYGDDHLTTLMAIPQENRVSSDGDTDDLSPSSVDSLTPAPAPAGDSDS